MGSARFVVFSTSFYFKGNIRLCLYGLSCCLQIWIGDFGLKNAGSARASRSCCVCPALTHAHTRAALVLLRSNWRVIGFCLVYKAGNRSRNLISSVGLMGHQLPVRRSSAYLTPGSGGRVARGPRVGGWGADRWSAERPPPPTTPLKQKSPITQLQKMTFNHLQPTTKFLIKKVLLRIIICIFYISHSNYNNNTFIYTTLLKDTQRCLK